MITVLKNSFTGLVKPDCHTENQSMHGGWMFLLIFLLSIITSVLLVLPLNKVKGELDDAVGKMPQFSYANGELTVDSQLMLPVDGGARGSYLFLLDTNTDMSSVTASYLSELAGSYNCNQAIFIGKDGMVVLQMGQANAMPWASIFSSDTVINNGNIKGYLVIAINIVVVIAAVMFFVFYIAVFYFCPLIYALIGLLINSIINAGYSFGSLYKIAFSVALPFWILKAVLRSFVTGALETIIVWFIRLAIITYIFLALYLKKKKEDALAMQAATVMNSRNDEINMDSFVSNHELYDDDRI